MPGTYIAKLTDNDTSLEVRFGKPVGPYSTGVVKLRLWIKFDDNLRGGLKIAIDESTMGQPASGGGILTLGGRGDGSVALADYTGVLAEIVSSGTIQANTWYILELEIDFSNSQVTGRVYDENNNLLGENTISLPSHITQVGCIALTGVGGSQTGYNYFDNIEVYQDTTLILSDDFEDADVTDWTNYFGTGTFEAVQEVVTWIVDYNGRAVKIRRGNSGSVSFTIIPNGSTDTINISVVENPNNLNISIDPSSITLDGSTNVTVTVTIDVPENTPYKPLFIVKLQLAGSEKTEYVYIGVLPLDETASKVVIRQAESDQTEYWVGAPGTLNDTTKYMLYRWRTPSERGHTLVLAKSLDGVNWTDIKSYSKTDYGYTSFEQSDIVKKPDGTIAVLYCAEYNGVWYVYKVETTDIENLSLPGTSLISNAKDPTVVYLSDLGKYIIGVSSFDITTSTGDHAGVLYESPDLGSITQIGKIPENTWNKYNQHIGDLHYVDGYVIIFYDGNDDSTFGIAKLGIALLNPNTNEIIDLTPDAPIWQSPNTDPTFRYEEILYGNDYIVLIAEEGQNDNSHDLIAYYDGTLQQAPSFTITDYPSSVSGTPNETKTISITVANNGNADGDCTVRIRDHNNNIIAEQTKTITAGGSETYSLSITLPSTTGTYTWTIEAYNIDTNTIDDSKTFTVNVVKEKGFPWWILILIILGVAVAWKWEEQKQKQQPSS